MIRGYSDHAANERTFLAWVRTGIAVIAFELSSKSSTSLWRPSQAPAPLKWRIDCSSKAVGTTRALRRPCSYPRRPRTYRGRNRALRPHRTIAR